MFEINNYARSSKHKEKKREKKREKKKREKFLKIIKIEGIITNLSDRQTEISTSI